MFMPSRAAVCLTALLAALTTSAPVLAQNVDDPPGRVARLGVVRGDVSFSPAGEDEWVQATLNRPLITGDRLWTGRGARAELQFGAAAVRLDEDSSFQILNLDDRTVQVEVTQGTLNLRVRRIYQDQIYEIDTPTLAFNVTRPGQYRVDVDPRGRNTTVAVWDGSGDAYGENASFPIRDGEAIRFFDSNLRDYEVYDIPQPDDFDRFCLDRDERLDRAASLRYVPEDLVGYSDLDEYGSWSEVAEYGAVWYPTHVSATWAPYRHGHWIWQDPFGWTWVDDASWGFAPFHYGRWAYIGSRWGWVPGPIRVRPVYAPALVAFVGGHGWNVGISIGGGEPVGWFPLGPREVYVPPYRASRRYFTGINITNTTINNITIVNVYNDYSAGRAPRGVNYAYRGNVNAITAVPGNVFAGARPVNASRIAIDREIAARAEVTRAAAIAPVQRSVIGAGAAARAMPQRQVMERAVVARNTPAPAVTPFSQRQAMLQRNPGEPIAPRALTESNPGRGRDLAAAGERVRVVGGGVNVRSPGATPTRAPTATAPRDEMSPRGGPVATPRGETATSQRSAPNPVLRTPPGQDDRNATPSGRDFGRTARERTQDADMSRQAMQRDNAPPPKQRATPQFERGSPQRPIGPAPAQQPQRSPRASPAPVLRSEPSPQVQREAPQRFERGTSATQNETQVRRAQPQSQPQRFEQPVPQQRETPQRAERSAPAPQQRGQPTQRGAPAERSGSQRDEGKRGNDDDRRGDDRR